MMPNDQYESDQLYWIEFESNKEQNVVTKIYLPLNDRIARVRAQRECVALERLNGNYQTTCSSFEYIYVFP